MNFSEQEMKKCALLFVHGFTGNIHIFDFLKPYVPSQCPVMNITLRGHGGDALDFSKASMTQWKDQINEAVDQLLERYGRVAIVAHSMGGLFALDNACRGRCEALFLLNPALRIRVTSRLLKKSTKAFLGLTESDVVAAAAKEAYGIAVDLNLFHYYGWPRRVLELFKEIRHVRPLIENINIPSWVFISGKDELIAPSINEFFINKNNFELTFLPASGHFYYTDSERSVIEQKFKDFLRLRGY